MHGESQNKQFQIKLMHVALQDWLEYSSADTILTCPANGFSPFKSWTQKRLLALRVLHRIRKEIRNYSGS